MHFPSALLVLSALLACGSGHEGADTGGSGAPAERAMALRDSDGGLYRVSLRPESGDPPLHRLHRWILHLEAPDGRLFRPARIAVDGGMPQHGHGFPTEPRVTRSLGAGDFLVEGVKFNMPGEWTFRFEIVGPSGGDVATFRVDVAP